MKQSIVVLDDVLPDRKELLHLIDEELVPAEWYGINEDHSYKEFCLSMLDIAGDYFHLSEAIGYEFWGHNGTRPGWHYDKDEVLYKKDNQLVFPLCSTVYYLEVSKLRGGELLIGNDIVIVPKTNRLVIFAPGIYHTVKPYQGKRVSLLVNPWSHTLCQ